MNLNAIYESKTKAKILIVILGLLFFVPFLGSVHLFDWDEINFAEAAREMIVTGDYSTVRIDYKAFHEKPPLFIWFQVASMKLFGVNEFAARFPNAIIGIATLLVFFNIGSRLFSNRLGLYWALMYFGSLLPHFYFKTGLIDPSFNLFMFLGVYYLYRHYSEEAKTKMAVYAGIFVALAVLTKGPVGYLLPTMTWAVYHLYKYQFRQIPLKEIIIYTIIAFIPLVLWYLYIAMTSESFVLSEFIKYHIRLLSTGDAGHSGPFYYHFVIILFACFPASFIAINSFRIKCNSDKPHNDFRIMNIVLFFVVLIIFSLVQTKIIHYSSLCYFPLTFLAAYSIERNFDDRSIKSWQNISIAVMGFVWVNLLGGFPYLLANKEVYFANMRDKVAERVIADNTFNIGFMDYLPAIIFLLGTLLFIIMIWKKRQHAYSVIFITVGLSIFALLPVLAPKLEYALQGRPIEFYQSLKDKDAYVINVGFKSYAPYFYNERKFENSSTYRNMAGIDFEHYLLHKDRTKPLYIVTKISFDTTHFAGTGVQLIKSIGGYNFFERTYK